MGWCSGSDIYHPVAEAILNSDATNNTKLDLLIALINALEDHDWDCQDDALTDPHPLVLQAFQQIHADWDWLFDDSETHN